MADYSDVVQRIRALFGTHPIVMEAADEIERLRASLKMLHYLDVTSREGQRAFNEWRNRSVANG